MAALLGKSLQDVSAQRDSPRNNRGASRGSLGSSRSAPYSKPTNGGNEWQHDMFETAEGRAGRRRRPDAGDDGDDGGQTDKRSPKLRIENLHYDVSEQELLALLKQVGTVADGPRIKYDKSGRSEGVAWVTYTSTDAAERAKDNFHNAMAKGQPITIEYDYSRNRSLGEGAALLARMAGTPLDTRSRFGDRGMSRGRGGGRGGGVSARGRGGRPRDGGPPKTEADLDAELDRFMRGDGPKQARQDAQMAE